MVNKGKFGPVPKNIQNCSIELKICILVHFEVIISKNNEFKPKKGQKG